MSSLSSYSTDFHGLLKVLKLALGTIIFSSKRNGHFKTSQHVIVRVYMKNTK